MEVNFYLKLKFGSFSFKQHYLVTVFVEGRRGTSLMTRILRKKFYSIHVMANLGFSGESHFYFFRGKGMSPNVALTLNPTFIFQGRGQVRGVHCWETLVQPDPGVGWVHHQATLVNLILGGGYVVKV